MALTRRNFGNYWSAHEAGGLLWMYNRSAVFFFFFFLSPCPPALPPDGAMSPETGIKTPAGIGRVLLTN